MKFQLKALAAAAILAAAIPAQAAIDTNASGNGSFILTVLDKVTNVSATFDLGKNYFDFNQSAAAGAVSNVTAPGTSFSWDLAGNANYSAAWTSFLGASTLANTFYAITAGDNNGFGSTAAASRGIITTYVGAGAGTTTNLLGALAFMDLYVANAGVVAGSTLNTVANGSVFVQTAEAETYYAANKNNGSGVITLGAIGTSLGVAQTLSTASNLSQATTSVFGNGAQFSLASNGALVYSVAAVPEADTWAMMMLGLGFMGFVARRKQA